MTAGKTEFHPFYGLDHSGPTTRENVAIRVEDQLNFISETCAAFPTETRHVDERAWKLLRIYIPDEVIKWRYGEIMLEQMLKEG